MLQFVAAMKTSTHRTPGPAASSQPTPSAPTTPSQHPQGDPDQSMFLKFAKVIPVSGMPGLGCNS